jgi:hypothetical protein
MGKSGNGRNKFAPSGVYPYLSNGLGNGIQTQTVDMAKYRDNIRYRDEMNVLWLNNNRTNAHYAFNGLYNMPYQWWNAAVQKQCLDCQADSLATSIAVDKLDLKKACACPAPAPKAATDRARTCDDYSISNAKCQIMDDEDFKTLRDKMTLDGILENAKSANKPCRAKKKPPTKKAQAKKTKKKTKKKN